MNIPTLEDVAGAAGVSTATVSRCLNEPERVADATRSRILSAVDRLGYSPNFGARALATRRSDIVGAVIPTMANAIFARGLQAFEETLGEQGLTLLVATSGYEPDVEEARIRTLVARGARGLLLIGQQRRATVYRFLQQHGIPVVIAWSHSAQSLRSCVGFDNAAAMSALTRQGLALGHRRLACISAERGPNDRARERVRGALHAVEQAGLDPAAVAIMESPYDIEAAGEAFERLMALDPHPTLVLCGNDVQAVGAMSAARRVGLRVPEDVSITGFDDLEIAGAVHPGLTTVRVPHREMGIEAARTMAMHLSDDQPLPPQRIALAADIIMRGSLAPPPGEVAGSVRHAAFRGIARGTGAA